MANHVSAPIKNNKDLMDFVTKQMVSLEAGKIDINEAKAQAMLSKQASNIYRNEMDKIKLFTKLYQFQKETG